MENINKTSSFFPLIDKGMENNKIVFDKILSGKVTLDLIYNIDRESNHLLKRIYISDKIDLIGKRRTHLYSPLMVTLSEEQIECLTIYYKKIKMGFMPFGTSSLVIGVTKDNDVILGAY